MGNYYEAFEIVKKIIIVLGGNLVPMWITVDFEAAIHRALAKAFPQTQIIDCLFHFKKALV